MPSEPLISVIVPVFPAAATLPGAGRSLLIQTCAAWQAILASDDGVDYLAVLARVGIRDDRLQQVFAGACGSGEGNARNAALALVHEEFLETSANGRAPWLDAVLAHLSENPAHAA